MTRGERIAFAVVGAGLIILFGYTPIIQEYGFTAPGVGRLLSLTVGIHMLYLITPLWGGGDKNKKEGN